MAGPTYHPHMKAVQILMDDELLRGVDEEARRQGSDRSKLVRSALERFLAGEKRRRLEEAHRRGYEAHPQRTEETADWEEIQEWPEV